MIKIVIADNHALVRSGLKHIVEKTADIVVAGEAANGIEVLAQVRSCAFDLLVLDISMPGINGNDLIRRVRGERQELAILVLTIHKDGQSASRALRAGAAGYLTKDSDPEILLGAIRKIASGGKFIDPLLVDTLVFKPNSDELPPHELLSDREFQVLQQLAAGRTVKEIASAYVLSAKTISTHKARLMKKLGLENTAALVRYAIQHRLIH